MYDPLETEISFEYLKKLVEECKTLKFGIVGGWAVFFKVNENYRKAFGTDYLKSRDIDVFMHSKYESEFEKVIKKLRFEKSSYFFRYKLIYDRERKSLVGESQAKKTPMFNLIEIFLDVFSNEKTKIIGSWDFDFLKNAKIQEIQKIPVIDIETLMQMKCVSFFEREKLDKEFKDACDIYALLVYSEEKIKSTKLLKEAVKKILRRDDLCDFIAENVLRDSLKSGIVKSILRKYA